MQKQEKLLKRLNSNEKPIKLIAVNKNTRDMKDFVSLEELNELAAVNEGVVFVIDDTKNYFLVKIIDPEEYKKKCEYQEKESQKKIKQSQMMFLSIGINANDTDLIRSLMKAYEFCKKEKQQVKLNIKIKSTRQKVDQRLEYIRSKISDVGLVIKEEDLSGKPFMIVYVK